MLSFSEYNENKETVRIWAPIRTGNYTSDCARGRDHAKEAIHAMRVNGNPALLGNIVKSFEQIEGVEVGFLYGISLELLATSHS